MVTPSLVLFYIAATMVISGGLGVVMTRNIVHAGFALMVAMVGVAGVFLLMFAEFLALVQILIYGGAIVIVILFALMLTRIQDFEHLTDHRQWPIAAMIAAGVFALLAVAVVDTGCLDRAPRERRVQCPGRDSVHGLGGAIRGRVPGPAGRTHRLDSSC